MRTVTKIYEVYKYEELESDVKERVKDDLLSKCRTPEDYQDICETFLRDRNFYEIEVYFSLGYSQGDGLCFEGELELKDAIKDDDFKKLLSNDIIDDLSKKDYNIKFKSNKTNHRYDHCKTCSLMISYDEEENVISETILDKLYEAFCSYYETICDKLETQGYEYFYEMSEEEAIEYCNDNELEFYKNGVIFN